MNLTRTRLSSLTPCVDLDRFDAGVRALPEADADLSAHTEAYTRLVLEVSAAAENPSAAEFATYFLQRSGRYSRTAAGRAAVLFETHLIRKGGDALTKFVETVLQDARSFLAVFEGELKKADIENLKQSVSGFAAIDVMVKAGDQDQKRGVISDVTIMVGRAVGAVELKRNDSGNLIVPLPRDAQAAPAPQAPATPTIREGLFEAHESGALRSRYGSWAVFEAPLQESVAGTIVVLRDEAAVVRGTLEEVRAVVESVAECFEDDSAADLTIEASLSELIEDRGWPVENHAEVTSTLSEDLRAQRDDLLEQTFGVSLGPAVREEAPAEEEEPETTDRMDEPEFYRDDLQGYYDLLVTLNRTPAQAKEAIRKKFGVRGLVITPTGEVRAPGVVDRPNPPPPLPPTMAPAAAGPPEEPEDAAPAAGGGDAPSEAQEGTRAVSGRLTGLERGLLAAPGAPQAALTRRWAVEGRISESTVAELFERHTRFLEPEDGPELWEAAAAQVRRHALAESPLPTGMALPLESVDHAFIVWAVYEDGDLDDFGDWVRARCPHLVDKLSTWNPSPTPLAESAQLDDATMLRMIRAQGTGQRSNKPPRTRPRRAPRRRANRTVSESQRTLEHRWRALQTLSASALRRRVSSGDTLVQEGRRALARTLRMRMTESSAWTGREWNHAGRAVRVIERLRRSSDPLFEDGEPTARMLALRAWGYDPSVAGFVTEQQARDCGPDQAAINRLFDSQAGSGPVALVEYDGRAGPKFDVLKRGKVELDPDERKEVMSRKAVWRFSHLNGPSPAVWKSVVNGKTWYVTNTHRAYNVTPTLKGTIARFHDFIKGTA